MKRLVTIALTGTAGAALVLGTPALALAAPSNLIKIDKGINGIRIGNKQHVVVNKMGQTPKKVVKGVTAERGEPYKDLYFKNRFVVRIIKGIGTTSMWTKSQKQRTIDDVGVGTAKRELRELVSVKCDKLGGGMQICRTGPVNPVPGNTYTTFRLTQKLVTEVSVEIFLD